MKGIGHACCVAGVAALLGCEPPGENRPHQALDSASAELRTAFNADSGKVRVVMLAAPT